MSLKQISAGCAVAGAVVLLAGCGSSGAAKSGTKSSTAASSSTPSPSRTVTPATVAQLRKIVLQPTDLSGWKGSPADPTSSFNAEQAKLTACVGAKNTDPDQVATTDSNDYTLGNATISSSASSYKSQSDLDSDVAMLKSPKLVPCFNQEFKAELATSMPTGTTVGALSMKFSPGPGAGPSNVAGRGEATVPVTVNGQQVIVYVNFVYLTGPLIEAEVNGENIGAPVPATAMQAAVTAVASRTAG